VANVRERLTQAGVSGFTDADIAYVLHGASVKGDVEKACRLLIGAEEARKGVVRSYNPNVRLLGAVNRGNATCYLDATLFAMFARLESFEAMLYKTFADAPRNRLAVLLRLWVNAVRTGELITPDIVRL
jgi:hypothetical protein